MKRAKDFAAKRQETVNNEPNERRFQDANLSEQNTIHSFSSHFIRRFLLYADITLE